MKSIALNDARLHLTPKRAALLQQLGMNDSTDVLTYYPYRYDQLNAKPISEWGLKERVTFEGEVVSDPKCFRFGRHQSVTSFDLMCQDHVLRITIYNRPWAKQLKMSEHLTVTGIFMGKDKVTAVNYNLKSLAQQEAVTPVYSVRTGISQRTVHECIRHVYEALQGQIENVLPQQLQTAYRLLDQRQALAAIHFPQSMQDVQASYRTLKYEEFLKFFLAVQMMRSAEILACRKPPRQIHHEEIAAKISQLPFALTTDQAKSMSEIFADMASPKPMYRLLQGDVGCGKTLVAALALYANVLAGYQGALLAPTEILARQHEATLQAFFASTGVRSAVLYAGQSEAEKQDVLQRLRQGQIDVLIGTHSILQENVEFRRLGMVIADEQQRFGVQQRRALREKGKNVDFLLMSATPIPRTLASTLYGDMDISTIETMPQGRIPARTVLIQENSFRSVLPEVREILRQGHQIYVICAAIEENEDYNVRNVSKVAESLKKLFAGIAEVGLLHGRMNSEQKDEVMQQFYQNRIQVLVSTTVVEVGMNVPNATGMIIYDADRFGLSQLHQLRGRIQRSSAQGTCWLLSGSQDPQAISRLSVLVKSQNGFEISYEDLRLRGPGDILGTRQSGVPDFILGNVIEDTKIIAQAKKDAAMILQDQKNPDYQKILDLVRQKNRGNLSYAD